MLRGVLVTAFGRTQQNVSSVSCRCEFAVACNSKVSWGANKVVRDMRRSAAQTLSPIQWNPLAATAIDASDRPHPDDSRKGGHVIVPATRKDARARS